MVTIAGLLSAIFYAVRPRTQSRVGLHRRGHERFARSYSLDEAQELHAVRHDQRRCLLTRCKNDRLVEFAVQQQAGQHLPFPLVQYVSPVNYNESQARHYCQSNLECHTKPKLL